MGAWKFILLTGEEAGGCRCDGKNLWIFSFDFFQILHNIGSWFSTEIDVYRKDVGRISMREKCEIAVLECRRIGKPKIYGLSGNIKVPFEAHGLEF